LLARGSQHGGAPTFFIDGDMFWGNDRLDWVEQALNA
jgi:2-hydroxychromene-2-carboxylate isomerase